MGMIAEYVVYEKATATYTPEWGIQVTHTEAHYATYEEMIKDWQEEFFAGTHNFYIAKCQA